MSLNIKKEHAALDRMTIAELRALEKILDAESPNWRRNYE